jgi:hypothetical protein
VNRRHNEAMTMTMVSVTIHDPWVMIDLGPKTMMMMMMTLSCPSRPLVEQRLYDSPKTTMMMSVHLRCHVQCVHRHRRHRRHHHDSRAAIRCLLVACDR